ncbi:MULTISPECIES: polysaccharide deacetylase family protein [unclassified Duganella]|uniref:polysaccharide deacetylase family protein n=1 Tax=unclassified Duganella TaxID=2636909 RepID=UPI000E3575AF|nr:MULTISPECIES: polysaccharide deacetylase family protein [unclassified Duganella]RFP18856.1 polysaccharide deacetylase family protein [Duganella sp. BJB475]RFP35520.1 polysaccharide deacetylase family protein [Duganella sp. BJB476]
MKIAMTGLLLSLAGIAGATGCGPDQLGTARTITLKREAALYGALQHAPLPLKKGEVVLTFDDGPVPATTPLVLKALADQCAQATFFMVGSNLEKSPELARRVVEEGHTTGVHSQTHANLTMMSAQEQLADLRQVQAAYQAVFGKATPAYRFPYLEETPTMLAALKEAGITVMSIDLGINDWLPEDTTDILVQRLVKSLDDTGGGIILMHDVNVPTAQALPALLKLLKQRGYSVVHLEWN